MFTQTDTYLQLSSPIFFGAAISPVCLDKRRWLKERLKKKWYSPMQIVGWEMLESC